MTKKGLKILAVDDDEDILNLIRLYLGALGHFVDTQVSPTQVLGRPNNVKPDLIISDINMPEMDGFEFVRRFRDKAQMKFVPFVVLTGESQLDKIRNAAALGAADYIVKPLDKDSTLEKLKKILDRIHAAEVDVGAKTQNATAAVHFDSRLVSVGEDFARILLNFAVPVGSRLQVSGKLFDFVGVDPGTTRVEECSATEDGFLVLVRFLQNDKRAKEAIRDWMNRNGA